MQLASIIPSRPRSESSDEQPANALIPPPKRKPHRKSRGGCLPCKSRHKRCDERKPLCTSCLVRGRECVYPPSVTSAEDMSSREKSPVMNSPITLLSATSSDPFQTVRIRLSYLSSELSNHLVYYQTRIRRLFNYSHPIDISLGNATFFQTALLLAAGHKSLVRSSNAEIFGDTLTYHKLEVMKTVRFHIESSPHVPAWMGCIVSGLVLANVDHGEYREAETHLNGLFKILDIVESSGQRLSAWLIGRITVIALALIFASSLNLPYGGTKPNFKTGSQLPTSLDQKILWAETSYFYSLFTIEFLRDQMIGSKQARRLDASALRWLRDVLSPNKKMASGNRRATPKRETSKASNNRLFPEEMWIGRIAVGALALTVGTMQPYDIQVNDEATESGEVNTENQDWLDDWIWARRNGGKPLTAWPWDQILEKIAWVETVEGFEFVERVYQEAERGK